MMNFFNENLIIAICFIIFIYFSYRPVKKAIIASLEAKIADIKHKINEAEKLKADAGKLLEEVELEVKEFERKKDLILSNAKLSTQRLIKNKSMEMELLLERKKESAIRAIENRADKIGKELQSKFINKSLLIAKQYLSETTNNSSTEKEIIENLIKHS